MMETSKITLQAPNKQNPSMAYRYGRAYERLFKKLSEVNQQRATNKTDCLEVRQFVKEVAAMAEGDVEL